MPAAESTDVSPGSVLIIGAGPAGTAAAITLARAGRRVVVVDKAVFPRNKCCGDGLTTLALRELEPLGLRPEHVPGWQTVHEVWLRSPSGREVCLPLGLVDNKVCAIDDTWSGLRVVWRKERR